MDAERLPEFEWQVQPLTDLPVIPVDWEYADCDSDTMNSNTSSTARRRLRSIPCTGWPG